MKMDKIIREVSSLLRIRLTGKEILGILARSRRGLLVSEIITRSGRSERAVRAHIKFLHKRRLVRRKEVITKRGKLAHLYQSIHPHELIRAARGEMTRRLQELEAHARGSGMRLAARTARGKAD